MPDAFDLFEGLGAVGGLDPGAALDRIGGRKDVYLQTIKVLNFNMPEIIARLKELCAAGDWPAFSIEAHGLKGSLRNIGAAAAGETAFKLERRGAEGDAAFCAETLPPFVETLEAMFAAIGRALTAGAGEKRYQGPGDPARFAELLGQAGHLLEAFEADEAQKIIAELSEYDFGPERNKQLAELVAIVESFNYDKAIERIRSLTAVK